MTSAYSAFRHRMDAVIVGYIECALWSQSCNGTADHEDCDGPDCDRSLDRLGYHVDDVSSAAFRDMEADVQGFVESCLTERPDCFDTINDAMIGRDFWLTRNGHGVGFWDRGLGELGDWLTSMAKPFGEAYLYVNNASNEVECES